MPQNRRARRDSVAGAVERVADTSRIEPPVDLSERALVFFDQIAASRERSSWTEHDLNVAAILANTMEHHEKIETALRLSGYTQEGRSGERAHPLLAAALKCSQSVAALTKTLGLSASQRGLTTTAQRARNAADRDARAVLDRVARRDPLLD